MHLISSRPLPSLLGVWEGGQAGGIGVQASAGAGGQRVDGSRRQRLGVLGRKPQLRVDRFLDLREGDGHVPDGRVDSCDFNPCAIVEEATQVNG